MNPKLVELLGKILLGAHPKSSWGGYVVGFVILAWQAWVLKHGGQMNEIAIVGALAAMGLGRSYVAPPPSEAPKDSGPVDPPSAPAAGFFAIKAAMLMAAAGALALGALLVAGCGTAGKEMDLSGGDSTFEQVQGAVDSVAPSWAEKGIKWLRTAEGKAYAKQNGLITTNGADMALELYAVEEKRVIHGPVDEYLNLRIKKRTIGQPSESAPPFSPLPRVDPQPTPQDTAAILARLQALASNQPAPAVTNAP